MSVFALPCIVDTNVAITANKVFHHNLEEDLSHCVLACVHAIEAVISSKKNLVIDSGDEIYHEYMKNLGLNRQPGVGYAFMKWVHDHRWQFPEKNRVPITPTQDGNYEEFPEDSELSEFDPSDRKFIAVANSHPDKPVILQATDSKWLGWEKALLNNGIKVHFLCPEYVYSKYQSKIGS